VIASYLRQLGIHCIKYLDDFGFALPARASPGEHQKAMWRVWAVFYFAGYTMARDKSMVTASTSMTLLGFGLDSVKQCYFVPEKKLADLLEMVHVVVKRNGSRVSVPTLQSLVGKAQSMALAVPPISIFLRSSYAALSEAARTDAVWVTLSSEAAADLEAFEDLRSWQRLSLWPAEQHIRLDLGSVVRLETDASMTGWGAVLYKDTDFRTAEGLFGDEFEGIPIHIKEMWAAEGALESFASEVEGYCIDLYTDNTVVQHALLRGSSRVPELQAFAKRCL
jgi:hypothetical protein